MSFGPNHPGGLKKNQLLIAPFGAFQPWKVEMEQDAPSSSGVPPSSRYGRKSSRRRKKHQRRQQTRSSENNEWDEEDTDDLNNHFGMQKSENNEWDEEDEIVTLPKYSSRAKSARAKKRKSKSRSKSRSKSKSRSRSRSKSKSRSRSRSAGSRRKSRFGFAGYDDDDVNSVIDYGNYDEEEDYNPRKRRRRRSLSDRIRALSRNLSRNASRSLSSISRSLSNMSRSLSSGASRASSAISDVAESVRDRIFPHRHDELIVDKRFYDEIGDDKSFEETLDLYEQYKKRKNESKPRKLRNYLKRKLSGNSYGAESENKQQQHHQPEYAWNPTGYNAMWLGAPRVPPPSWNPLLLQDHSTFVQGINDPQLQDVTRYANKKYKNY